MSTKTRAGAAGQAAALPADRRTRKPNPLKCCSGLPPLMPERRYFVMIDIPLRAGTLVNGQPVPEGAVLTGHQLHVCRSRGQGKKALRRIRQRHPRAYLRVAHMEKWDVSDWLPCGLVLPRSGSATKGGAA